VDRRTLLIGAGAGAGVAAAGGIGAWLISRSASSAPRTAGSASGVTAQREPARTAPAGSGASAGGTDGTGPGSLAWQFTMGNIANGYPYVANGVVYTGNQDNFLYAIGAATGSVIGSYGSPGQFWGGVFGAANGILYAIEDLGALHAFEISSGAGLWNASPNIGSLSGIPLIVSDGSIYLITDDGILYSMNTANGQQNRSYPTSGTEVSQPAVAAAANGTLYFSAGQSVQAVNAKTGSAVWSYTPPRSVEFFTTPAVGNGLVFIGAADDSLYAMRA